MLTDSAITTPVARTPPSWWRSPQRVWLRRAIFQIHLWTGIVLALYSVVIGLSGSALVFREEIQNRTVDSPGAQTLQDVGFDQSIRLIESQRPGWHATGLEDLNENNGLATLLLEPTPPVANYRMVLFNPRTGQVFSDRLRFSGFWGFLINLHFYLLAGSTGLKVSGAMAIGLLVLCISGVILWWPGVRRWASALILHRRVRWQRFNWDLHSVIGFWSCLALLLVTFTGIYFAFPKQVQDLLLFVTQGHLAPQKTTPVVSHESKHLTIDQAIAAANQALPNAPIGYLQIPNKPDQPYSATGYYTGSLPYSQLVQITLDPHTGAVLSRDDTRQQPFALQLIQYFFTLHFGSFGGTGFLRFLVKLLWVALGIVPALLAVTGLLMYLNRKLCHLWTSLNARAKS